MKNKIQLFTVVLHACSLIALSCAQATNENPGLRFKVSSTGLNLVKDVALDKIKDDLKVINIPTYNTRESGFRITLSDMKLSNLNFDSANVATKQPNIFTPSISGGSLEVSGRFRVSRSFRVFFFRPSITHRGRLSGRASGVSFSLDINSGVDSEGKPTFHPVSNKCQANIRSFNVKLSGNFINRVLSLILRLFRGKVKRFAEEQICPALLDVIRKEGNRLTARFNRLCVHQHRGDKLSPAIFPFPLNTRINLGLGSQPNVDTSSTTVTAVGRCFSPVQNPSQSFNFQAPVLPSLSPSSKMVSISISSYVMNTCLVSFWQNKIFFHRLSQDKFIQAVGLDLFDSSSNDDDLGDEPGDFFSSLPALLAESPNFLEVIINATSPPIGSIHPGGIVVRGTFSVAINIDEGGDYGEGFFPLFDPIVFDFYANASISVSGNKLSAIIGGVSAVIVEASGFPDEIVAGINLLLRQFIPTDIVPVVNSLIESGFELQEYFGYTSHNPTVEFKPNALEITSDFIHTSTKRQPIRNNIGLYFGNGTVF